MADTETHFSKTTGLLDIKDREVLWASKGGKKRSYLQGKENQNILRLFHGTAQGQREKVNMLGMLRDQCVSQGFSYPAGLTAGVKAADKLTSL